MKVLLITDDPTILDTGSSGHARAKENAVAIGELYVLISTHRNEVRDEGSLRIYAVKNGLFSSIQGTAHKLIRTQGIQAVWAQDPFELGALARAVAERSKLPLYVNVQTDFLSPWYAARTGVLRSAQAAIPSGNRKRVRTARKVLAHAAGIRVMTERVKATLLKEYGTTIKEPVVIPLQVHAVALPVPFPFSFPFTLVAAGRLDAVRRVVDIIDGLALIKDQYPGVGLFVIGDGPERKSLEHHAASKKLKERVIFLGDRRDTQGLMRSANVFIQASAYEGYGRRLLQAALARIPIITTDVGLVGEVFKGYEDVLAMPPGDPAALATHIKGLIEDAPARQALVMNAERAAKQFLVEAGDIPRRVAQFLGGKIGTISSV